MKIAGDESKLFSTHPLQRGGKLQAFRSGVPDTLIQVQGNCTIPTKDTSLSLLK